MKRTVLLALILMLALCGCAGKDPTREAHPWNQGGAYSGMISTEQGTYLIEPNHSDFIQLICVLPKGADTWVPLCARPNCDHNSKNCGAYAAGSGLGYYNGRLYAVGDPLDSDLNALDVVSMAPDGTDRRTEAGLPWLRRTDGSGDGPTHTVFHDGRLYVFYDRNVALPYEDQIVQIYMLDLETGEFTRLFENSITPDARPILLPHPVGRYIYDAWEYTDPEGSREGWCVRMDPTAGEVKKLFPFGGSVDWDLYYADDACIRYLDPARGLAVYDLATGETAYRPLPMGEVDYIQQSADLICATRSTSEDRRTRTTWFLNTDLEILGKIDLTDRLQLKFMDEHRLYFGRTGIGEQTVLCWADRNDIAAGLDLVWCGPEGSQPDPEPEGAQPDPEAFVPGPIEGAPAVQGMGCERTVETELGLFRLADGGLELVPSGETRSVPVNGGPEGEILALGWFRDRLWFACPEACGNTLALYSLDPATGETRTEQRVESSDEVVVEAIFHENSLLAVYHDRAEALGPGELVREFLRLVDLPTGLVREVGREFMEQEGSQVLNFKGARGEKIILLVSWYELAEGGLRPCQRMGLAELDIPTGRLNVLFPTEIGKDDPAGRLDGQSAMYFYTDGEKIFYVEYCGDFMEYDCGTGILTAASGAAANADGAEYLEDLIVLSCSALRHYLCDMDLYMEYIDMEPEARAALARQTDVYFYSRDYEKLGELHFTDGTRFRFATSDGLFFANGEEDLYIPRAAAAAGDLTLRPAGS